MNASDRSAREKEAIDVVDSSYSANEWLHDIFDHVRSAPNTERGFDLFYDLIKRRIAGADVLEIGCGSGAQSRRILGFGAKSVHGIDISTKMIELAQKLGHGDLRFFEHDAHQPLPQKYDIIFGRAILHHLDYQSVLRSMYYDSLNPGGIMIFMEPLGENLLLKLYWRFGTAFHTDDERPFFKKDLNWLNEEFPDFKVFPINYSTIVLGLLSSFLFKEPDNIMTRAADRIDRFFVARVPFLHSRFRSGIFYIRKPV